MPDLESHDAQDSAEAFDEENFDELGESGEVETFEGIPDVIDLTHKAEDDEDEDTEDLDPDETVGLNGVEADADVEGLDDEPEANDWDGAARDPAAHGRSDDVELTFVGSPENLRGAQGSAAHFESRAELSDDDVEALGYGPDED